MRTISVGTLLAGWVRSIFVHPKEDAMKHRTAPYDSRIVANSIIEIARQDGEVIDPMKLQKLVYIAHGFFLALYGCELIRDPIEAWKYGPVIPRLYYQYKHFGSSPITDYYVEYDLNDLSVRTPFVSDKDMEFLGIIWKRYGRYSAIQLSSLTHQENTPWTGAYDETQQHVEIAAEAIRSHYQKLLVQTGEARSA